MYTYISMFCFRASIVSLSVSLQRIVSILCFNTKRNGRSFLFINFNIKFKFNKMDLNLMTHTHTASKIQSIERVCSTILVTMIIKCFGECSLHLNFQPKFMTIKLVCFTIHSLFFPAHHHHW